MRTLHRPRFEYVPRIPRSGGKLIDVQHVATNLVAHGGLLLGSASDLGIHVIDRGDSHDDGIEGIIGLGGIIDSFPHVDTAFFVRKKVKPVSILWNGIK